MSDEIKYLIITISIDLERERVPWEGGGGLNEESGGRLRSFRHEERGREM